MTTDAANTLQGLTAEQIRQLINESGVLDEMRTELLDGMPTNGFANADRGGEDVMQGIGSGGFPWQYWKKRDGRVITGPEPRETLYMIYARKGYTPLPQYGKLPTPGAPVPCCPNLRMKEHQFHVLMANGGAKEMAVAQVINAGWHLNPPVVHGKRVVFPQLKGVKVVSIECDECDKPLYGIEGSQQIVQALRQHGRAVHGFSRREVNDMLYRIGYLKDEVPSAPRPRRGASTVQITDEETDG